MFRCLLRFVIIFSVLDSIEQNLKIGNMYCTVTVGTLADLFLKKRHYKSKQSY